MPHLLLIDCQNDFCDLPPEWCPATLSGVQDAVWPPKRPAPALPVPGAHADMLRLSAWLLRNQAHIDALTLTFDTHQRLDIAHPAFWVHAAHDAPPAPFTAISAAQLQSGEFRTADPAHQARALAYVQALEAAGRYRLTIWPVHCELGTWGHGLHPAIAHASAQWQTQRHRFAHSVIKGLNPWTEHYSALRAEVPDPAEPAVDAALLARLLAAQTLIVAGEASSHCVRATVQDLLTLAPPEFAQRIILLTDCMSAVAGFEAQQAQFFDEAARAGARLMRSDALDLAQLG